MPRNKSKSHERIIKAAKEEFFEKGFEKASMREIGRKAGMTSAGLYRHYESKEAMFEALVEPAEEKILEWYREHKKRHYEMIDERSSPEEMFNDNELRLMIEIIGGYKRELQLIFTCAQGTKYANFIHQMVEIEQKDMWEALEYMKEKGMKIHPISEAELHMIISAYTTALLEPIIHDWPEEEIIHCFKTMMAFFMPGWQKMLGF